MVAIGRDSDCKREISHSNPGSPYPTYGGLLYVGLSAKGSLWKYSREIELLMYR
jgi:hypothetical protein